MDQLKTLLEQEFPVNEQCLYLNHAAVAPWPESARRAVVQFAAENVDKGATDYPHWLETENRLRANLAKLINASVAEVAFVKNTSEALSFVAYGLKWNSGDVVIISDEEFPSNSIVWESLAEKGVVVKKISLQGAVPEEGLINAISEGARLLSISAVQYASGIRLDLKALGEACRKHDVLFCVDAIQATGALAFDVDDIQCDFAMADGHKWLLGPEGLGFFYVRSEHMSTLSLNEYGWHMVAHPGDYYRKEWDIANDARRFECGSPNLLAAHALEASTSLLCNIGAVTVEQEVTERTTYLADKLTARGVPLITPAHSIGQSGIITFATNDIDPAEAWKNLMGEKVICMHRGGGIRFSPHVHTPYAVIDEAVEIAVRVCGW